MIKFVTDPSGLDGEQLTTRIRELDEVVRDIFTEQQIMDRQLSITYEVSIDELSVPQKRAMYGVLVKKTPAIKWQVTPATFDDWLGDPEFNPDDVSTTTEEVIEDPDLEEEEDEE